MYYIDIIINKKEKWSFKDHLLKNNIDFSEWFFESRLEQCIISLNLEDLINIKEIYNFLEKFAPNSRLILPNGKNIKPSKGTYEEIEEKIKIYFEGE